jgi:hypothetical protein
MTHSEETQAERDARVPAQLTQADVSRMFAAKQYAEIEQARKDGLCNVIQGRPLPSDPGAVVTQADISKLFKERRYDEISRLRSDHKLDHLFDPTKEN